MSHQYQMRLYDPTTGLQTAVFDDWNSVYFFNRLSDYGYHTISIYGDDPRRSLFVTDAIIEVWRRNVQAGIPWYIEYAGFHRTNQDSISDRGAQLFTSYGRSYEDLLTRRAILYPSGTPGDTKTGPADDVMKAYVRENVGPQATIANGRLRDGVTAGLTVSASSALADMWNGSNAARNVMATIQAIGLAKSVDFSVRRTGPATFNFDAVFPRLGTDRSGLGSAAPLVFGLTLGNMSQPFATLSRVEESNIIVVLGQGEGTNRTFVVVEDATAEGASPWNGIEKVLDARNEASTAGLIDLGLGQLEALKARRRISFTVLESESTVYGRDYFVGDTVLAQYRDAEEVKRIVGVEITVAEGKESIRPHFDNEPGT